MAEFTLASFAAHLTALADLTIAEHEGLEKAAVIVETEAKSVIGTYRYGWPQLAPSTLTKKSANTPLLETGAMQESIQHRVGDKEARIGSNDDKAVWQELGTSRGIPPRSFLAGAARHKAKEVVAAIGDAVYGHLTMTRFLR